MCIYRGGIWNDRRQCRFPTHGCEYRLAGSTHVVSIPTVRSSAGAPTTRGNAMSPLRPVCAGGVSRMARSAARTLPAPAGASATGRKNATGTRCRVASCTRVQSTGAIACFAGGQTSTGRRPSRAPRRPRQVQGDMDRMLSILAVS